MSINSVGQVVLVRKKAVHKGLKKVATSKPLKKVVKKKHTTNKNASGRRVTNKRTVEQRALRAIRLDERVIGRPESVPVEEVEEIVSDYREHTRTKLAREFPKIVDNMLAAAIAGRLTDTKMKLLLDLAGVKDDPREQAGRMSAPGLGKLLLNEIERRRKAELAELNDSMTGESGAWLVSECSTMQGAAM